ncbi:MAG: DNA translocase FtsK 4TM domain-containing protein [Oligoflexales bacterium]
MTEIPIAPLSETTSQLKYIRLLTVILILYYYSCLFSFSPHAPSPFSISIPEAVVESHSGKWGTMVAGIAVYYLGISAYIFPLITGCCLFLKSFKISPRIIFPKFLTSMLLFIAAISQTLEITMPIVFSNHYPISTAGSFGSNLNLWTEYYFGSFGSIGFIAFSSALALVILFSNREPKFLKTFSLWVRKHKEKEPSANEI